MSKAIKQMQMDDLTKTFDGVRDLFVAGFSFLLEEGAELTAEQQRGACPRSVLPDAVARHFWSFLRCSDGTFGHDIVYRPADLLVVPTQETGAIDGALVPVVLAPVDHLSHAKDVLSGSTPRRRGDARGRTPDG